MVLIYDEAYNRLGGGGNDGGGNGGGGNGGSGNSGSDGTYPRSSFCANCFWISDIHLVNLFLFQDVMQYRYR